MSESYWVFARKKQQEALMRVGSVEASDSAEAVSEAKANHGQDWLEMVAIPQARISWAIEEKSNS